MDGHFVPNLTWAAVVRSIKRVARLPLDVQLMIEDPDRYIPAFVEAGAGLISVHVKCSPTCTEAGLIKSLARRRSRAESLDAVGCLEEVAATSTSSSS